MSDKSKFSIKRKNLTAIKEAKAAKEKEDLKPQQEEEEDTATKKKQPKGERYVKRKPLTKLEQEFLKDFYYKREEGAYAGRDALYNAMKAHYAKQKTPKGQQISRRRMWEFFLSKQMVNQIHRQAPQKSEVIKPINSKYKLDKGMCDLILRGGDSARTYKGILCVVDVSTRKGWTEVITSTTAKHVSGAMEKILKRVFDELPEADKKQKQQNEKDGKSKTFTIMGTDGGSEFKSVFASMLKSNKINQVVGVANRSTSQSIVERFNGNLQASMAKESSATDKPWHELVEKHTRIYNNKTHRLTRLKETEEEMKERMKNETKNKDGTENKGRAKQEYKVYSPNELYEADRNTLQQLHDNKANTLGQQNKDVTKMEERVKVGDTVRLVDMAKRKGELQKGYKPNYSKELYYIYKIHKPRGINVNKPRKYYVKDKETDKTKKIKNRSIPYTIRDFMVVDPDVQEAPSDIKINTTPKKAETRSEKKEEAEPLPPRKKSARIKEQATKPEKAQPKKPKKPQEDPEQYVGKRVKSMDKGGKLTGKGKIVSVNREKSYPRFDVEWDKKYNYEPGTYTKSDIKKMLV
jgi:hypothetical protein